MSTHKHLCHFCSCIWEHSDECKGKQRHHRCPKCGEEQWDKYLGDRPATEFPEKRIEAARAERKAKRRAKA